MLAVPDEALVHCAKCEVEGHPKAAYKVAKPRAAKTGRRVGRTKHQRVRQREALEGAEKSVAMASDYYRYRTGVPC